MDQSSNSRLQSESPAKNSVEQELAHLNPKDAARIKEILAHPTANSQKKSSTGWTIFWLIIFTPIGWYFIWKKTAWPTWAKIVVTVITIAAVIGLIIESELIALQVTSTLGGSELNSLL